MTRDEMLADLAYARTLAEEGRQTPLVGGGFSILFGVLLAAAYCAQYAVLAGHLPNGAIAVIWISFGVIAGLGCHLLSKRVRQLPGGASFTNQADRWVWNGVAIAILCVVVGSIGRGVFTNDFTAPNVIMAAGFGMYGVALYTTGRLSDQKWLEAFAWIAWAASLILWFFLDETWAYLVAAAASVTVLIVPGVLLLKREPSAIV